MSGQSVVITGGGRGLGRAYSIAAAEAGASVVVSDVDESAQEVCASLPEGSLGPSIAFVGSVADPDEAAALINACMETYGQIDGLVNNAGVLHLAEPWDEQPGDVMRLMSVNVLGTIYPTIHALKAMRERGSGSVINTISGAHLGMKRLASYGASKGAVASLTYGWAEELRGTGCRVNAVSPVANTRMSRFGRRSAPSTVAPLVLYLLSRLSEHLNGEILRVDGGSLSRLQRPQYGEPIVRDHPWTVSDLAAAVEELVRLSG